MSRPGAPQMPTARQIADAYEAVRRIFPDARIAGVGPDGVRFTYGEDTPPAPQWQGKPFEA